MDAAAITAGVGAMGAMGTGARFIWLRIERRLSRVEDDLMQAQRDVAACKERHASDRSLLVEVLTVLQLVADVMKSTAPESPVLAQIHRILDRVYPLRRTPPDMGEMLDKMQ